MPDTTPTPKKTPSTDISDRPFTRPETEEGIGPILGEDVSPEHERDEDARYRREHPPE